MTSRRSNTHRSMQSRRTRFIVPILFAAMFSCGLVAALAVTARGAELIPSVGMTRAKDADQAKTSAGLALRAPMVQGLMDAEIGAGYRSEDYYSGNLTVHTWPVTASLWLTPLKMVYAGGGVGWYNNSFHYNNSALQDETTQKVGVHLGGGLKVPLGEKTAMDLNGRYVFMQKDESKLVPTQFNPDSWTTSLGLAIGF